TDLSQIVAARQQGLLDRAAVADLPVTDVGEKSVAQAFPPDRIRQISSLPDVGIDRLGGAAVAEATALHSIRRTEIAQIADSLPRVVDIAIGDGAVDLDDLEGEAGR